MTGNETLPQCCAGPVRQKPVLTCGSCGICRYCNEVSSAALEERAQDGLQAQRACGFRAVQHPGIAKSLKPADNEAKHGGVAEPIRRF
jgi:hypothetical protein